MKLKYIISILLVTLILDIIQSKCISNVTKGITNDPRNESSLPLTTVITTTLQITTSDTIITTKTTSVLVKTVTLTSTYPSTSEIEPTNEISTNTTTTYSIEQTTTRFTVTADLVQTTTRPISEVQTTEVQTTTTPFPSVCNNSPFQILPYTELNLQAIQDFKIEIITDIRLEPVRQSVTCACASRCQLTTNCVYFESYPYYYFNCYLYKFKSRTTKTLKTNLQRGVYYTQGYYTGSGLLKTFFS
jgi:hypothetical protein